MGKWGEFLTTLRPILAWGNLEPSTLRLKTCKKMYVHREVNYELIIEDKR